MGRAEHISGEGSQRGDRHLDGIEAEEVSGSDPQFLEQPPPADIVGGCVGDWWTPVEGGEHRQRLGIGLQQSGEWAARAADGNERGGERRIVGEEFGGARSWRRRPAPANGGLPLARPSARSPRRE